MKKLRISRKYDWIRIAFILNQLGQISLEQLTWTFNEMFHNGKTNREISRIITCYSKKGFERTIQAKQIHYSFNSDVPEIHRVTRKRWELKIESLKGFIPK
jgi:hypothetical protein